MADKTTFKLKTPIKAHAEELTQLEVRRPTVQEIRAIKVLPYVLTESNMPVPDMEATCKYLAVCAAIPQGSVEQLSLVDLNGLAWLVTGFFLSNGSEEPTT